MKKYKGTAGTAGLRRQAELDVERALNKLSRLRTGPVDYSHLKGEKRRKVHVRRMMILAEALVVAARSDTVRREWIENVVSSIEGDTDATLFDDWSPDKKFEDGEY